MWKFLTAALLLGGVAIAQQEADLVIRGGTIHTVDDAIGTVRALAAHDGRIVAVGDDADVAGLIGDDTEVIELEGRTVVPGFIEGHGHFLGMGEFAQVLDLTRAETWEDIVRLVARAAEESPAGTWIVGRGWHQEKWRRRPVPDVEGFPTHELLSSLTPDHPVSLTHASGHAAFFNRRAMELAGIDRDTTPPTGGEILHGPDGEPCGVFR